MMVVTLYIMLRYIYRGGVRRRVRCDTSKLKVRTDLVEVWDKRGCWYEVVGN